MRLVLLLLLLSSSSSSSFSVTASAQYVNLETIKSVAPQAPTFKAAAQEVFEYKLDNYPKEAGACLPIARKIRADMERIAKVKVLQSICQKETEDDYTIVLNYKAPQALQLVSTARREEGFGAYESLNACQAALGDEAAAFQQATGLEPVVQYCFSHPLARDNSWTIHIDSFGQARLNPEVRSTLVFTYPPGWTKKIFTGHIKEKLQEQGVNVRSVVWRGDAGYANLNVSYYAEKRLALKMEEPFRTHTQAQCEAELAEVDRHLATRQPGPLIRYCGTTFIGGWELAWLFKDQPSLKTVKASDSFRSYEACVTGKDGVIQFYRDSMGHEVLGAACSAELLDHSWRVVLLE